VSSASIICFRIATSVRSIVMRWRRISTTWSFTKRTVQTPIGLSRSTLYLRIADGVFTRPVSLGGRAVGWPAHEVAALNAARIAGKPDSEIRALVTQLEAVRKAVA
jgi:prophage regulatory protein